MKAIITSKYGAPDTLEFKEVEKPVPKADEVLVKIHAASVNYGNIVLLRGKPYIARLAFGLRKPKFPIPGGDMAGTIEAIGEKVTEFKIGDEVYGDLSSCGWGTFAEYATAPEKAVAHKPRNLSFQDAAAVPMAATTALQAIQDSGNITAGQKVLIHGGSGGVGTFAVQIAKAFGAEVTTVVSTRNVAIAHALGADHVIDYKKGKLDDKEQLYDLVIGVNGSQRLLTYKKILQSGGRFIHVGGTESQMYQTMFFGPFISMTGNKKMATFLQRPNQGDLIRMKELIEAGQVKPVIDRSFSLQEVPEALMYFEEGHSQGKVVITIC